MSTLYVRDIPAPLYAKARKIAAANGQSWNSVIVDSLKKYVQENEMRDRQKKALDAIRARQKSQTYSGPLSEDIIRALRDGHVR